MSGLSADELGFFHQIGADVPEPWLVVGHHVPEVTSPRDALERNERGTEMSADIAHPPVRTNRKKKSLGIALVSALTVLGLAPLPASPAGATIRASKASAGNGYILMIHSTFEPHGHPVVDGMNTGRTLVDQLKMGTENGLGVVGATRAGDSIVFRAIPYLVANAYPVVVGQPQLEVDEVGGGRRLLLQPNLPPDKDAVCQSETHWDGHEGPVEACSVYRVPAHEFDSMQVVSLTLHFVDGRGAQEEVHNAPAHQLLHDAILGAPVDLKTVDGATTEPTPLLIENVIDTKRPMAWRGATARLKCDGGSTDAWQWRAPQLP